MDDWEAMVIVVRGAVISCVIGWAELGIIGR